jgi:dethiobiotin synthetase
VTGTDTGVGKTVLTALLVRRWRELGVAARALKPLCSGGRDDARVLREAQGGDLSLDTVNPWHFRSALTPLVAAEREGRTVALRDVVRELERARVGCDVLVVEGAGGLLSPLGRDFDSRTLIRAMDAKPVVVAANRLGCLSQVFLLLEGLGQVGTSAPVVLMQPLRTSLAARTNRDLLRERLGPDRVLEVPWLRAGWKAAWKGAWVDGLDRLLSTR